MIRYVHLVIESFGTYQTCQVEVKIVRFRWHPTHEKLRIIIYHTNDISRVVDKQYI